MSPPLPPLPANVGPTLATLHAYSRAVAAVPRAHAVGNVRWWHVGMTVRPDGLTTEVVPLGDGRSLMLRLDLRTGHIHVEASDSPGPVLSMTAGMTGTQMGDAVIAAVEPYGLSGPYDRSRFADDSVGEYDPNHAAQIFTALTAACQLLAGRRAALEGDTSPILLWPHGFDVSFEWYGSRRVDSSPAQLNLGFFLRDRPYFYSSPWPFDAATLLPVELPHGAAWHTEGWEGSILFYDEVAGLPDGRERVLDYAGAVFAAALPTLTV